MRVGVVGTGLLLALAASAGCKPKASASDCTALLDRYAQLVVLEKFPDASAVQIEGERTRERTEARGDDAFKNCSSEVSRAELECAMKAATPEAMLKCLE
ncbi:MAG: hypothetical protein ACRENE_31205 [Polyangiaceae bacterium]